MRSRPSPGRRAGRSLLLAAGAALIASPTLPRDIDAEWVAVPPQSLVVPPGSALDFSAMVPDDPPGSRGPVVPRGDRLVFAGDGTPARFNCAMMQTSVGQRSEFPTHAESDAIADQLRRHGYSLLRQQFVDFRLTRHARFDVDIDAKQLDRFYYLLAALKRKHFYSMLDIVTGVGRGVRGEAWNASSADDLRVRMHFDPAARSLWLKLVDAVFARRNPYTGLTPLEDPALVFVSGANENSMAFARTEANPFPTGFGSYFDRWVRGRFPTAEAVSRALPDLNPEERAGAPIALPAGWKASGPRMALLLRYVSEREIDTDRWMSARLAERGFHGPNLADQDWSVAKNNLTRAGLPVIDVHAYGGEVTSFRPGSTFFLPSATADPGLGRWLVNAGVRWLDRPIVATEYDAPFPGPYRYESGILFPALAAFQGYDMICRTTMAAIELEIPGPGIRSYPIRAYTGGLDPGTRAQETLAAMLFYRGDVAPATRTIAVAFGQAQFDRPGSAFLPAGIGRGALLARYGLVAPDKVDSLPPDSRIVQAEAKPDTLTGKVIGRLSDLVGGGSAQRIARLVADLRADGTLGPANRTDPARGIFQSQTGELTVDQGHGRILVVTPRTEAASTTGADRAITLGAVTIDTVDGGALIGTTALDGLAVARSRKLLIVLAGEVRNTDQRLTGAGDTRTFQDWGRVPIELRRIRATLALRGVRGARLTALSLRGTALATRHIAAAPGAPLRVAIDTAAVAGNPTTFFLLERD